MYGLLSQSSWQAVKAAETELRCIAYEPSFDQAAPEPFCLEPTWTHVLADQLSFPACSTPTYIKQRFDIAVCLTKPRDVMSWAKLFKTQVPRPAALDSELHEWLPYVEASRPWKMGK